MKIRTVSPFKNFHPCVVCSDKFPPRFQGQRNKFNGFYMHPYLLKNLDSAKKAVKKDWDMFFVIDGPEGSGKSVLAQQVAQYVDPNLTLANITFGPGEFRDAVLRAKRFSCIVFDEAYGGLSSRKTMSATNNMLVKMMTEIRQRNLFIIIVLPSFFDLDKYVAIHRSRCLIHVYHHKFQRGFFRLYSFKQKKLLYLLGKKTYNYNAIKRYIRGKFPNFYTLDIQEYKEKKLNAFRDTNKEDIEPMMGDKKAMIYKAFKKIVDKFKIPSKLLREVSSEVGAEPGYLKQAYNKAKRDNQMRRQMDALDSQDQQIHRDKPKITVET